MTNTDDNNISILPAAQPRSSMSAADTQAHVLLQSISKRATGSRKGTGLGLGSTRALPTPAAAAFPILPDDLSVMCSDAQKDKLEQLGGWRGIATILRIDKPHVGLSVPSHLSTELKDFYGDNLIPQPPIQSFMSLVKESLEDTMLRLLLVASLVALILGSIPATSKNTETGWVKGVAVFCAVFIVVMITSFNNWTKERQFQKLNAVKDNRFVNVIRDGKEKPIPVGELLVGDTVVVQYGDKIPADGVFISGHDILCDESGATGEPDAIKKGEWFAGKDAHRNKDHKVSPFFLSGTTVLSGYGRMLVVAVGVNSFNGKSLMALREGQEDTPLQEKLGRLADQIGRFGMAVAAITCVVLIVKLLITQGTSSDGFDSTLPVKLIDIVILCITIVVVAVPEGLPLAVTIALAYGMMKMLADKNLVRHLDACETMGGATTICSDKTGTLTQNKMTVVRGVVGGQDFDVLSNLKNMRSFVHATPAKAGNKKKSNSVAPTGAPTSPLGADAGVQNSSLVSEAGADLIVSAARKFGTDLNSMVYECLCDGVAINTTAYEAVDDTTGKSTFIGSKTESALLDFCKAMGSSYQERRRQVVTSHRFAFNSSRKRMSTLVRPRDAVADAAQAAGVSPANLMVPPSPSNGPVSPPARLSVSDGGALLPQGQATSSTPSNANTLATPGARKPSNAFTSKTDHPHHAHIMNNSQLSNNNLSAQDLDDDDDMDDVDQKSLHKLYVKGAAEVIIQRCTHVLNNQGQIERMSDKHLAHSHKLIADMASECLRTIAMAYRIVPNDEMAAVNHKLNKSANGGVTPRVGSQQGPPHSYPSFSTMLPPLPGAPSNVVLHQHHHARKDSRSRNGSLFERDQFGVGLQDHDVDHDGAASGAKGAGGHVTAITAAAAHVPLLENIGELDDMKYHEGQDNGMSATVNINDASHPPAGEENNDIDMDSNLVLVGLVGIMDPLRPEVPGAVRTCQRAGVRVIMVTGDNVITARNIAKSCHIYNEDIGIVMEGPQFRQLSPEAMQAILPRLQVLARSSPTDKQLLVKAIKATGEVVAVTGDGTNDAPALQLANVGFSMGIAGTEVAKEASDVVLMDDNFASIIKAIMWGRNIFDAIRCFLQFQLTVNGVAVAVTFIGAVSNHDSESPLSAVQLLWLNLIMDTFAALALATEPPTDKLLTYKPYGRDEPLITRVMWRNMLGQGIFQLAVELALLYRGHVWFNVELNGTTHKTLLFNVFVICQLFNEFNSRKIHGQLNMFEGVLKNQYFLGVEIFSAIAQVLIVEFGGSFTETSGLSIVQWVICVAIGALSIPVFIIVSLIPIKDQNDGNDFNPHVSRHNLHSRDPSKSNVLISQKQSRKDVLLSSARNINASASNGPTTTINDIIKPYDEGAQGVLIKSGKDGVTIERFGGATASTNSPGQTTKHISTNSIGGNTGYGKEGTSTNDLLQNNKSITVNTVGKPKILLVQEIELPDSQ